MTQDRKKDRHAKTEHRRLYMRDYYRRWAWKKKFGLEPEEVHALVEQQDGACAICHRAFDLDARGYGRAELFPHVDHDHDTGAIRGLLCNSCNVSIGRFGECVDTMRRAIDYLTRNKGTQPKLR
jgi:hypothetical protein